MAKILKTAAGSLPQLQLQKATTTNYVVGIDAGATKTMAGVGLDTTVLGYGTAGPANIHVTIADLVVKHLAQAVAQAVKTCRLPATSRCVSLVVGMSGIDAPSDQMKGERLVRQALRTWLSRQAIVTVSNDIHIVRRSGSAQSYGISLIAGTGSHGFGINRSGDIAYTGGLEYILSDEGSAFDIGCKALRAAVRSADGRVKFTSLQTSLLKHFGASSVRGLVPIIYRPNKLDKAAIAALATLVEVEAARGDWYAKKIMEETLAELVLHVTVLLRKLRLRTTPVDIVVAGGLWSMKQWPLLQQFQQAIKRLAPKARVIIPSHPPVWGAVKLAQEQLT
ncbi:MAG: hypothetical protein HYV33_01965 [Candidatus Kerfeldbacteria bacterium]|nr:hypothetical protein [Candidatus Kerfeldbacteria bacterium]